MGLPLLGQSNVQKQLFLIIFFLILWGSYYPGSDGQAESECVAVKGDAGELSVRPLGCEQAVLFIFPDAASLFSAASLRPALRVPRCTHSHFHFSSKSINFYFFSRFSLPQNV